MDVQHEPINESVYRGQGDEAINSTNDDDDAHAHPMRRKLIRVALALVVVGFIVYAIIDSQRDKNIRRITLDFLNWVEENPASGIFAFIGVYFTATILFIPGSLLTLGSGFVFANIFGLGLGVLMATIAVFVGASTGSIGAFLLGRYLLRENMKNFAAKYPVMLAIDSVLEKKGLRIVFLMRLSPVVPFNAINYILGITAVSLSHYSIACFGMLPGTIFYVFLGSSAGNLVDIASSGGGNRIQGIIVIVVGLLFGIAAVAVITFFAKKELKKIIAESEESEENLDYQDIVEDVEVRED